MSLKEDINTLKADFSSLQNFLKEKLVLMEVRIGEIEIKMSRTERTAAGISNAENRHFDHIHQQRESAAICNELVDHANNNIKNNITGNNTISNYKVENLSRNIIEELMWESTLSEAVLHVREAFKDQNSREKFLRYSLEMVLEKDEQYRKMVGTLFGFLINQNIVNATNVFNSLSSVLLVIENHNHHNSNSCGVLSYQWQNLTEILLPMISDSHIKLSQLQRKAHTIMKEDHYRTFINHLQSAIDENRRKLMGSNNSNNNNNNNSNQIMITTADTVAEIRHPGESKLEQQQPAMTAAANCCMDINNMYDLESITKYKAPLVDIDLVDVCSPVAKCDVELLLNGLSADTLDDALLKLKRLSGDQLRTTIEEMIDMTVHKDHEQRIVVGTLLSLTVSQEVAEPKFLLTAYLKSVLKVERLILNQKTRCNVCNAFADILLPLFSGNKLKWEMLVNVAALILTEETKTIFLWSLEKALNENGARVAGDHQPSAVVAPSPKPVSSRMLKRFVKYMGGGVLDKDEAAMNDSHMEDQHHLQQRLRMIPEQTEQPQSGNPNRRPEATDGKTTKIPAEVQRQDERLDDHHHHQQQQSEKYMSLKRKKMMKERIENYGDNASIKGEEDTASNYYRHHGGGATGQEGESNDMLVKGDGPPGGAQSVDLAAADASVAPQPPAQVQHRQPENLPSSVIKEKIEDIIEKLMRDGNVEECVATIKENFNECQTDLVFKAAFEYTKDKNSEYRMNCGHLISEAFKYDPKRIGAQIMNTISLELGDYEESPELWSGLAEIISSPMINGLIRFTDLKLLPKYFLHTIHCGCLLLAILKQIMIEKGPEWLTDNWRTAKVDLNMFLPANICYKFIIDNDLQFLFKDTEINSYKESQQLKI